MNWVYCPDENPKRKHHWNNDYAGFVEAGGIKVGKCPRNLSMGTCTQLLNEGIPWSPARWFKDYPKRIYAIHEGVVYRATPTQPGRSYHGFPELPERFPPELAEELFDLARRLGCETEVRRWLKST